ncbi:hypothetical protein DPX16_1444 [Anabarilius grahami]|uniref:Uncharacterized protein n=1 Tax=Anabarilius grahami TaxID=495550 RepID=A0A3N0YKW5_ANAGA|nr:hypothetical protein DPX16_1444 [Anabarilius grahami]
MACGEMHLALRGPILSRNPLGQAFQSVEDGAFRLGGQMEGPNGGAGRTHTHTHTCAVWHGPQPGGEALVRSGSEALAAALIRSFLPETLALTLVSCQRFTNVRHYPHLRRDFSETSGLLGIHMRVCVIVFYSCMSC